MKPIISQLPKLENLDIQGKKVLVRADLDFNPADEKNLRLQALNQTLDFIQNKAAEIILLAHRGRPSGQVDENLSLKPFAKFFNQKNIRLEENLRFEAGEEENNPEFAQKLASLGEVYINEAFGNSHREHASIVGLPGLLPHAAGLHFVDEIKNLGKILENPPRPVVFVISGVKNDKLKYLPKFVQIADKILIGGRLPESIHDDSPLRKDPKIVVADLVADKEDLTRHSIEVFEKEIAQAGTIVLSGPVGHFEEEGYRQGTELIFRAVAQSRAAKFAGGGETVAALDLLELAGSFDWISVGGGATLEFLATGTLPGIEALIR